ncbi:MAG: hypothetical protein HY901_15975, partial [Deltaproteobacteria bacterium]|nr:hypothetical protein [Deltaproteobacteria bacterium]
MRALFFLSSVAIFASGCDTSPLHSNPYDPSTPKTAQAKGIIQGVLDRTIAKVGGETIKLSGSSGALTASPDLATGAFVFPELVPDTYDLDLQIAGFLRFQLRSIIVAAGQTVDLGLLQPSLVPEDSGGTGSLEGLILLEQGGPAQGAHLLVYLERTAPQLPLFVTDVPVDTTGRFEVRLPVGTYTLLGKLENYFDTTKTGVVIEQDAPTQTDLTLKLSLNPAVLKGVVWVDCTGATLPGLDCSKNQAPAQGATITVSGPGGGSTTADPQGRFELANLQGGDHLLQVGLAGFHDSDPSRRVTLVPGQTLELAEPLLLLLDRGTLTGKVVLSDHRAIDSLDTPPTVSLRGTSMQSPVTPVAQGAYEGTYRFDNVPAVGSYDVEARAIGYTPAIVTGTAVKDTVTVLPDLQIAAASGAFTVDDGESNNVPGYTRVREVSLVFSFPPGAAQVRISEDGTFQGDALPFAPFTHQPVSFTLSEGDGKKVLFAQYKDTGGTLSRTFSSSVVLDTAGPVFDPSAPPLTIEGGALFTRRSQQLTLTLIASDTTSGLWKVRLARDGEVDSPDASFDYVRDYAYTLPPDNTTDAGTPVEDGLKEVWVQFEDRAGNLSQVAHASITVDTLAPQTPVLTIDRGRFATQDGYTSEPRVSLHLSASEQNGDQVLVKLASTQADLDTAVYRPLQTALTADLADPGTDEAKTLFARFTDLAGNEAPDVSASVVLDTRPPAIDAQATGLAGGVYVNATSYPTLSLSLDLTDVTAGLPASPVLVWEASSAAELIAPPASATWQALSHPLSVTLSNPDGVDNLVVRGRDRAGNAADAIISFVIDTQRPVASGLALQGVNSLSGANYSASRDVALSLVGASADLDGTAAVAAGPAATTSLSCNQSSLYTQSISSLTAHFAADGANQVVLVCLRDRAGNVSAAPLSASLVIDTGLPAASATLSGTLGDGSSSATLTTTEWVQLHLTAASAVAEDVVTDVQASEDSSLSSAPWQAFSTAVLFPLSGGDGLKTVYVRVRTAAGRLSTISNAQISLSTTPTLSGTVLVTAVDPNAGAGYVSGHSSGSAPDQVTIALTADRAPVQYQLSINDPTFATSSWAAVPVGAQPWSIGMTLPVGTADGVVKVYARYRDAALNVSSAFLGTIRRLSTPPTGLAISFPATASGYTNRAAIPVALAGGGATRMRVSCDASIALATLAWEPFSSTRECVLIGVDGSKTVSAQFMDIAGNVATAPAASVNLVQSSPTAPVLQLTSAPGTLLTGPTTAITRNNPFTVTVLNPASTTPYFARLEVTGASATFASDFTAVTFALASGNAATDAENRLQVHVVDLAGNVGPDASLVITHEQEAGPVAPVSVSASARPGAVSLSWPASTSLFTTGYYVSYGLTAAYGGTGADQGVSAINVGRPCNDQGLCSFHLSGLSNFAPVYSAVTAYSALQKGTTTRATNPSPITPQPFNFVSLGTRFLGASAYAVSVADDRAYVVENDGLEIVSLADPANPAVLGRVTFDGGQTLSGASSGSSAVEIRWPYAFVGGPDGLYSFNVRNESSPSKVGKLATGTSGPVQGVAMRLGRAYLNLGGMAPSGVPELWVVDITNPASPSKINSLSQPASFRSSHGAIAVTGTTVLFTTGSNSNVRAASVEGVTGALPPTWLDAGFYASYDVGQVILDPGPTRYVYALESTGSGGRLLVYDYTNPSLPTPVLSMAGLPGGGPMPGLAVGGGDVYVAGGSTLTVVDLAQVSSPRLTAAQPLAVGEASGVAVAGSLVVVVGTTALQTLQAANLSYPTLRGQGVALGRSSGGGQVIPKGRVAFVPGNGLSIFDVANPSLPALQGAPGCDVLLGCDYGLGGTQGGGGLAMSGDLLFTSIGSQNGGTALLTYSTS